MRLIRLFILALVLLGAARASTRSIEPRPRVSPEGISCTLESPALWTFERPGEPWYSLMVAGGLEQKLLLSYYDPDEDDAGEVYPMGMRVFDVAPMQDGALVVVGRTIEESVEGRAVAPGPHTRVDRVHFDWSSRPPSIQHETLGWIDRDLYLTCVDPAGERLSVWSFDGMVESFELSGLDAEPVLLASPADEALLVGEPTDPWPSAWPAMHWARDWEGGEHLFLPLRRPYGRFALGDLWLSDGDSDGVFELARRSSARKHLAPQFQR